MSCEDKHLSNQLYIARPKEYKISQDKPFLTVSF